MSPSSPILITIDSNEAARPRAAKIVEACGPDTRHFVWNPAESLPFDLKFAMEDKTLHIEIKDFTGDDNSDYLSSILSGHLWEQVLAARELQEPLVIAVLGDDADISSAIRKAAGHGENGNHGGFDFDKFTAYANMVDGFEANCIGAGIQIWHLGYNQFPRLLLRVRKILQGGDLSGFAPKPADGERAAVGLSILAGKGIGPAKAGAILEHFKVWLVPEDDSYLTDCAGIGPTMAVRVAKNIRVGLGAVVRPKSKARKLAEVLG